MKRLLLTAILLVVAACGTSTPASTAKAPTNTQLMAVTN